jgi:hypothetical protein
MVAERLAERPPDTTHQLVEFGRRLSALEGADEVGPHDLKRYNSISTAGPTLSVRLIHVIRLVWTGPLPDRRSNLIDQRLRRHWQGNAPPRILRLPSAFRTAGGWAVRPASPSMTPQPHLHDAGGPTLLKPRAVVGVLRSRRTTVAAAIRPGCCGSSAFCSAGVGDCRLGARRGSSRVRSAWQQRALPLPHLQGADHADVHSHGPPDVLDAVGVVVRWTPFDPQPRRPCDFAMECDVSPLVRAVSAGQVAGT